MRVGLYAPNLACGTPSGVERHVRGLLEGLAAASGEEDFVLFTDARDVPAGPRWRSVRVPPLGRVGRLWWDHRRLARAVREEKLDLLHCPKSAVPAGLPCPAVFTVHDLLFMREPGRYGWLWKQYWTRAVSRSVARAAVVLCVSEATRADLERFYPGSGARARVVPNGVQAGRFATADGRPGGADPERPYFFFVGNLTRRKNVPVLLEAHRRLDGGADLLIAGAPDYGAEDILAAVRGAGPRVRWLGSVDDLELARLYRHALALVYPSAFEGFGLPLLEAMAAGCPVVSTTGGALPEAAGDAAVLVPPGDAGALAEAMRRVSADAALREDLVRRGRGRAAAFTWKRTADLTLEAYRAARR